MWPWAVLMQTLFHIYKAYFFLRSHFQTQYFLKFLLKMLVIIGDNLQKLVEEPILNQPIKSTIDKENLSISSPACSQFQNKLNKIRSFTLIVFLETIRYWFCLLWCKKERPHSVQFHLLVIEEAIRAKGSTTNPFVYICWNNTSLWGRELKKSPALCKLPIIFHLCSRQCCKEVTLCITCITQEGERSCLEPILINCLTCYPCHSSYKNQTRNA